MSPRDHAIASFCYSFLLIALGAALGGLAMGIVLLYTPHNF